MANQQTSPVALVIVTNREPSAWLREMCDLEREDFREFTDTQPLAVVGNGAPAALTAGASSSELVRS